MMPFTLTLRILKARALQVWDDAMKEIHRQRMADDRYFQRNDEYVQRESVWEGKGEQPGLRSAAKDPWNTVPHSIRQISMFGRFEG